MSTQTYEVYLNAQMDLLYKRPFYYHWISQMRYIEVDSEDTYIQTAGVVPDIRTNSFKLFVNPEFFSSLDPKGAMFILAHEVLHLIFDHCYGPKANHFMWNIAVDLAVNTILMDDGFKMILDEDGKPLGITPENVAEKLTEAWTQHGTPKDISPPPPLQSGDWYFTWLMENAPPPPKGNGGGSGGKQGNQDSDGGRASSGNDAIDELLDKTDHDFQGGDSGKDPHERELERRMVAEKAQEINNHAPAPGRGAVAGQIEELIKSLKPKISWQAKLRNFAGQLGHIDIKTTMNRENKYGQFPRVVFKPGKKILVAIDTSGSVGSDELGQFLAEVEEIAKHCALDLMNVDYEVASVENDFRRKSSYAVKGRGGTDMRSVFKWIRDTKSLYDGVIVFTDGDTPYPATKAERCGLRTLWVLTQDRKVPDEAGEAVYFDKKDQSK
jgi:predicted metal-dependent peptidase